MGRLLVLLAAGAGAYYLFGKRQPLTSHKVAMYDTNQEARAMPRGIRYGAATTWFLPTRLGSRVGNIGGGSGGAGGGSGSGGSGKEQIGGQP